ncbi:sulfatase family protein [Streptomyces sp. NPDC000941]
MTRPNLLFVFADQLRGQGISPMGNADVRTPALAALAGEGAIFPSTYANTPVCTPNRASLITGLAPAAHRVVGNDLPIPTDLPTIATVARDHGYRTGYIGKWHLAGVPRDAFTPPGAGRMGFDWWAAFNCSHSYMKPVYHRDTPDPVTPEGYEPEVQTALAEEFLASQGPDTPFCLFLSWGPPHDPYDMVPDEYKAMYDPDALTLRPNVVMDEADEPRVRRTLADYYAAVTALDTLLGRLLRTLEERGLAENTIVVFSSDHGDMLWSHGEKGKQSAYEESVLIPFLARWPGHIPAGLRAEGLFSTVDTAPTLLALMGLPVPESMQGADCSPTLLGHGPSPVASVLLGNHTATAESTPAGRRVWRGVRTARHTYVELVGHRPWMLFDNTADPHQLHNLVDDPGSAALRGELAAELGRLLTAAGDPFLDTADLIAALGLEVSWQTREDFIREGQKILQQLIDEHGEDFVRELLGTTFQDHE